MTAGLFTGGLGPSSISMMHVNTCCEYKAFHVAHLGSETNPIRPVRQEEDLSAGTTKVLPSTAAIYMPQAGKHSVCVKCLWTMHHRSIDLWKPLRHVCCSPSGHRTIRQQSFSRRASDATRPCCHLRQDGKTEPQIVHRVLIL